MNGKVAVIGLGAMGAGVARSLLGKGFQVHACDVRDTVRAELATSGAQAFARADEAARGCKAVIVFVVNAEQTEAVLFGEHGAVHGLAAGAVVLACATVSPADAIGFATRLSEKGILMLDAPVSGGAIGAAKATMTMMTSGPAEAYAAVEDVLAAISGKVYRLGAAHGLGSKVKIVNQLLAGVHIAAAAEAMALGIREGVDPTALYDIITHSAGNSWMFENRMPHVLSGDYTPLSAVDIFVKDLGLVLDTARKSKFPLPLSAAAHQMFMMASTAGYAREDDAAVIKIFPGIRLPKKESA